MNRYRIVSLTMLAASVLAVASGGRTHQLLQKRERVPGGVVTYLRSGQGEPVLLIHGFAETARMWRPLIPMLSDRFTVIAPNLPGLDASSPMPGDRYDMRAVATRLHDFVQRLGFRRIRVVGHDIGLMAAFAYASMYPGEVTRLALMDAPIPGIGDVWPKVFNDPALWHFHFPTSPIALRLVKGRERTFLDHFWISFSGNPNRIAITEGDRKIYARIYARSGAMRAALGYFKAFPLDALENADSAKKAKLAMPILTIEGGNAMNGALKEQASEVGESVDSLIVAGAGHWLMEERPREVEVALRSFLTGAKVRQ